MRNVNYLFAIILPLIVACGESSQTANSEANSSQVKTTTASELVVYSARKEHLIKPLFDRFTELTGIKVSFITDSAGPLLARLQAEGASTPADMLITVDAGNLWQAEKVGILNPLSSVVLERNIPANLRDPNNSWYALTIRARTIVYATDRVNAEKDLHSYEDLAKQQWKGKLCLRTSKKVYNQSLIATMIAALGEESTETVVRGWVDNLAMAPFSNDTKVMEAIIAGQCDVGIVNTYYFGRLIKANPGLALSLYWPNQQGEGAAGRGTHVNVSGAGVTKHSRNKRQAQQLLEWLSDEEAQGMLMSLNREAAVNPSVKPLEDMLAWGEFKADSINVSEAGRLQVSAVKLMDRAGYK